MHTTKPSLTLVTDSDTARDSGAARFAIPPPAPDAGVAVHSANSPFTDAADSVPAWNTRFAFAPILAFDAFARASIYFAYSAFSFFTGAISAWATGSPGTAKPSPSAAVSNRLKKE